MAERNELSRSLSCHDASDPCHLQRIALGDLAAQNQPYHSWPHPDPAPRHGRPQRRRFAADIDHLDAATRVDVREGTRQRVAARHAAFRTPALSFRAAHGLRPASPARKNDRLSSETVRSTLLSLTCDGTRNVPGEKFSTALIPAWTTVVTTSCAENAGTAITANPRVSTIKGDDISKATSRPRRRHRFG